jgi:hypothetical protein
MSKDKGGQKNKKVKKPKQVVVKAAGAAVKAEAPKAAFAKSPKK